MVPESIINELWSHLMDERVGIIGVYGKGGVGKTTLLKQIYKKLAISPHDFDSVIWVTVSHDQRVEKIVDDIWRRIGVIDAKWVEKSFEEKAEAIHDILCQKKFVLILDDIWEKLDLAIIGVPTGDTKSKVLLTSRSHGACLATGAQKMKQVEVLDKESAWELFKNLVGEDKLRDPKIHDLAFLITRICRGLPVLVCTVARAMASRTTHNEWKYAFKQVKLYSIQSHPLDDTEITSSLLKFCFHSLPNDKVKSCFFYYTLFPEDFTILKNNLIDFWICEQLFDHDGIQKDILNLGYNTIDTLIGACLLEEEEGNCVKLQDLIRDCGLDNAITDQTFAHAQLIEAKAYDSLKTVGWISSMANFIQNLTDVPRDLLTFFLNHNPFVMIKGEFSQFMNSLTVLDLSNSGVAEVPRWISELVSLQCLNLSHTWIEYLPLELKMLAKLKCLNLEHDEQLRIIPRQVIYGLSSLQVLKIFRCGFSVEELEDNILSVKSMDIDPLLCLEHVKVLSITITCESALYKLFDNPKLLSCTQSLSLEVFWGSKSLDISPLVAMENLLTLEIHQVEELEFFVMDHGPELLKGRCFQRLREVRVEKCPSLCDLTWIILAPNLSVLKVKSCDEMTEIINIKQLGKILNGEDNLELFAKLEILELESLPKLKSIYWKSLPLQCLKKMEVIDCSLLKKLPLNSDSTNKRDVVIESDEDWWKDVEWEDDATKAAFLPFFKPRLDWM